MSQFEALLFRLILLLSPYKRHFVCQDHLRGHRGRIIAGDLALPVYSLRLELHGPAG